MKPRKPTVPAPIKDLTERACRVSYETMGVVETALRWPCVRAEVMAWAEGCRADNTGWAEYEYAQRIIRDIQAAERLRLR